MTDDELRDLATNYLDTQNEHIRDHWIDADIRAAYIAGAQVAEILSRGNQDIAESIIRDRMRHALEFLDGLYGHSFVSTTVKKILRGETP